MYKKILVPLDGSGLAECVFQHVKAVATGCSVPEVDLLHVIQRNRFPYDVGYEDAYFGNLPADVRDEGVRKAEAWGKEYLGKIAADFEKSGIAATKTTVLLGNAPEQILDFATKNGADLIIMSTHGRSGPSRWAFGSTSEKVVRSSPVPVMVVRPTGCSAGA